MFCQWFYRINYYATIMGFCPEQLRERLQMPPTCSFDVAQLGPVFLLKTTTDANTREIIQPVKFAAQVDEQMLKDLRMASFTLEVPPTILPGT